MSLGCPRAYTVELRERGGRRKVGAFTGVTQVDWARLLTGTSTASVQIKPRNRACARLLNQVTPWAHELCVWRDADRVWEGPVTEAPDDGSAVTVTAKDLTGWLPHRIVHGGYDTTGNPMDVAALAAVMLTDAYAPHDPEAARHLEHRATGITVARTVEPESVMADADLAELVKLGLEWVVVGRTMLLTGGSGLPLGRLAALSGRHFTGNMPVTRTGENIVTRAVVQGGGVRGEAGGVHPVVGLLERLETQANVATAWDAQQAAQASLYTPSLMLAGDAQLSLTARAPVTVRQLIPGAVAVVSGKGAAIEVSTEAVLSKVAVTWDNAGEKVGVTFVEHEDTTTGTVDG